MKTKLLLYCTKGKPSLNLWRAIGIKEDVYKAICEYTEMQVDEDLDNFMNVEFVKENPQYAGERIIFRPTYLNGKIVAECECEVEEILKADSTCHFTNSLSGQALMQFSKLSEEQLEDYLGYGGYYSVEVCGYALHLTNIKVFEKPLELSDVKHIKKPNCDNCPYQYEIECDYYKEVECEYEIPLTKAPQNMCWVWYKGQKYCLISIRPEWLCKILNGEKPVEVRRKILKGML